MLCILSKQHPTTDEALQKLIEIQESAAALFLERRADRDPGQPTRMQTFVLRTISERGPFSVSELAEILNVSIPTASQLVNTMTEHRWLLTVVAPQDRRRHEVHLTEYGAQLLRERFQKRLARVRRMLDQLSPEERGTLVSILDKVVKVWTSTDDSEGSSTNGH